MNKLEKKTFCVFMAIKMFVFLLALLYKLETVNEYGIMIHLVILS